MHVFKKNGLVEDIVVICTTEMEEGGKKTHFPQFICYCLISATGSSPGAQHYLLFRWRHNLLCLFFDFKCVHMGLSRACAWDSGRVCHYQYNGLDYFKMHIMKNTMV